MSDKLKTLVVLLICYFFITGCGKNPVGTGSSILSSSGGTSSSIEKYKTGEGTGNIQGNPQNSQSNAFKSLNNLQTGLSKTGISINNPISNLSPSSKALSLLDAFAPPDGYTGPTTGPDGTGGWYKNTVTINQSGYNIGVDYYIKTSPGDYYINENAKVQSISWWIIFKGSYNISGIHGNINGKMRGHMLGLSATTIGGYFSYEGDLTANGQEFKWNSQWGYEVSSDTSGKFDFVLNLSDSSNSYAYSGNIELKSDGSGDGKVYQNNSLFLTIHWNTGGKTGYYITSDGKRYNFG